MVLLLVKKQSKVKDYLDKILDKIIETPLEDMPRLGLYLYLTYISVVRFNNISMGWFGPLAMRLVEIPSHTEGAEISFGLMGTTVRLPNPQQIGLGMLAVLGILNVLSDVKIPPFPFIDDSLPMPEIDLSKKPDNMTEQQYVQQEVLDQRYTTDLETYLKFRRSAT